MAFYRLFAFALPKEEKSFVMSGSAGFVADGDGDGRGGLFGVQDMVRRAKMSPSSLFLRHRVSIILEPTKYMVGLCWLEQMFILLGVGRGGLGGG